jgi:hypothetical protein
MWERSTSSSLCGSDVTPSANSSFAGAKRFRRHPVLVRGAPQRLGRSAKLQLAHDLPGEGAESLDLLGPERPGNPVGDAERAYSVRARSDEWHSGAKADARLLSHDGIPAKTLIGQGIRHHQRVISVNGVSAKRHLARALGYRQAKTRFEPQAVRIHQADQRVVRMSHSLRQSACHEDV